MSRFVYFRSRILAIILFTFFLWAFIPAGTSLAQEIGGMPVPEKEIESESNSQRYGRDGFTLLLTMGLGLQQGSFSDGDVRTGLGGLNLGIGGFVSPDLAVMFRISGTSVQTSNYWGGSRDFVSGVGGIAVQYWASDSFNVEAGLGMGFWGTEYDLGGRGAGVILGGAWSFYHGNTSSLQLGLEYAPAFVGGTTIHNLCLAFGWQLL